jgi:hypothetical protein
MVGDGSYDSRCLNRHSKKIGLMNNPPVKYSFEVLTEILTPAQYGSFIDDLQKILTPSKTLELSFGWDPRHPDDKQLADRTIPPSALAATLQDAAKAGFSLGEVDVWISGDDFEFQFCNDRDLHLRSNNRAMIDTMVKHWKARGFTVYENGIPL